ncbi:MAG: hypothetical protein MUE85_10815 [Microscillaceae bacterium]|jgi:hypothetical protein|nr:hypothetical protein [Microscillaceae bacterium]
MQITWYSTFISKSKIFNLLIISILVLNMLACSVAPSNLQVVYTEDCGKTWQLVPTGQRVPSGVGNMCYRVVMIPNYQLQGESKFKVQFSNKVNAFVDMDYIYTIVEPLKFITQSRGIGTAKYDTEASKEYIDNQFESTESILLDKKIKDICRAYLITQDVVDFDANFEKIVFDDANKALVGFGVKLESLDIIPSFGEQTTEAIDATTALRIYESKGMKDQGIEIIKAKAGASKIVIQSSKPEVGN